MGSVSGLNKKKNVEHRHNRFLLPDCGFNVTLCFLFGSPSLPHLWRSVSSRSYKTNQSTLPQAASPGVMSVTRQVVRKRDRGNLDNGSRSIEANKYKIVFFEMTLESIDKK